MKGFLGSVVFCFLAFVPVLFSQDSDKSNPPPTQDDASPKPAAKRIRMGGQVMSKQLKHRVTPAYPKEAQDQRIQGTVRMHVIIGKDGKVILVELISGHPALAQAALDAVRKWEYKPVLLNGEAVEVDTTVDTVFSFVQ
jgi:protein TonB